MTRIGKRRTDTNRPIKTVLKNNEDQKVGATIKR